MWQKHCGKLENVSSEASEKERERLWAKYERKRDEILTQQKNYIIGVAELINKNCNSMRMDRQTDENNLHVLILQKKHKWF